MVVIGDKNRVLNYLEERYGKEFDLVEQYNAVGTSRETQMRFPVWAFPVDDPDTLFKVWDDKNEYTGANFTDNYVETQLASQAEALLNNELETAGIKAVSYCMLTLYKPNPNKEEIAMMTGNENLMELLAERSSAIRLSFYIAIYDTEPSLDALEKGIAAAFKSLNETAFGNVEIGYHFLMVETDTVDAFKQEVARNGIEMYREFQNAVITAPMRAEEAGSFSSEEGYQKPLRDSLKPLLERRDSRD